MIDVKLDLSEFERAAKEMGGWIDQVPYALSLAMNDSALGARQFIIDTTWPKSVTVRKQNFLRAALRTRFASKRNLEVVVYDVLNRASLQLHATGGVKKARGRLAIPSRRVTRTGSGVRSDQKPRNLRNAVVKGNAIFQRIGRKGQLRLMYVLRPDARIKRDVPFYEDFEQEFLRQMHKRFPLALEKAMRTAFKK